MARISGGAIPREYQSVATMKRILLTAIVVFSLGMLGSECSSDMANFSGGVVAPAERPRSMDPKLVMRGQALRKAIDDRYRSLVDAKQLKSAGNGTNSLADVVENYIPVGSKFEYAENVLRAAGFKVGPRGPGFLFPHKPEVRASIDFYVLGWFSRTDIGVAL
jgi:hypothetical protein